MVALPTKAEIEQSESKTAKKPRFGNLAAFVAQLPGGQAETELTVSGGAITPDRYLHRVDTEADASTDDLDNILLTNLPEGSRIKLRGEDAARVVTLRHQQGGDGELVLNANESFELSAGRWIILERRGSQWVEVTRSTIFGRRVAAAADAAALRTLADAQQTTGNLTENTSPGLTDFLPMLVGGSARKVQLQNVLNRVSTLTALTTVALADVLPIYDDSVSAAKSITPAELLKVLNLLTEDTLPDLANDWLLTYDASAGSVKKVAPRRLSRLVQRAHATYATHASSNNSIPLDDSIPQSNEGLETVTASITPVYSASIIRVTVSWNIWQAGSNSGAAGALFRDSGANALAVQATGVTANNVSFSGTLIYEEVAGSTLSRTYKFRCGSSSGTYYINGNSSGRLYGGVMAHRMTIEEVMA